jgi:hypothetical protein
MESGVLLLLPLVWCLGTDYISQPPEPPTYDETLERLEWVEKDGRRIPIVFIRWQVG